MLATIPRSSITKVRLEVFLRMVGYCLDSRAVIVMMVATFDCIMIAAAIAAASVTMMIAAAIVTPTIVASIVFIPYSLEKRRK